METAAIMISGLGNVTKVKRKSEIAYWRGVYRREGQLTNDHYTWFYTSYFDLSPADYSDRHVLDIGCGPRGSLEWADMASERVGLDPLVDEYRALGIDQHKMTYVKAGSENIPFPDGHFDIVTSFNSLDHVDDLGPTVAEITRVTASGGLLLLISDVGHDPTFTEPLSFSWDVIDRFTDFDAIEIRHLEKSIENVYASVKAGVPYDHANPRKRYGMITAKLRRR
jgi:ubiquinone/menaquinone biosynthesis C-methylase UbiE